MADYEGPFDTDDEALDYIRQFVNESRSYSLEMLNMVVIHCEQYALNLVKRDGVVLDGWYLAARL